jgi:hypothetical protein
MSDRLSLDCYVATEKGIHPKPISICTFKSATVDALKIAISNNLKRDKENLVCIVISKIPKDTDLLTNFFKFKSWPIYVYISKNSLSPLKTYAEQLPKKFLDDIQVEYKGVELIGLNDKPTVNNLQSNEKNQSSKNKNDIYDDDDDDDDDYDIKRQQNVENSAHPGDNNQHKPPKTK